jgi:molybdate transport system substrate-binding protein
MRFAKALLILSLSILPGTVYGAGKITIAAASDLRFALDEIVAEYRLGHPDAQIQAIYGSSGKMSSQIMHGAPFDIFFSADIAYPEKLHAEGFAVTQPEPYAIGRIVLWSKKRDASKLTLEDLAADNGIKHIAIAQPTHAPYGARAREALIAAGIWDKVQPRLVYGENIAHTAQMVESGAVDVGIIALSLALFPGLAEHGYYLIDDALHNPLTQGFVITNHGANNPLAHAFAKYLLADEARTIMARYGFVAPGANR